MSILQFAGRPLVESKISLLDGECNLIQRFLSGAEADQLFDLLYEQVQWQQTTIKLFGKIINSPRLSAWYGDPGAIYRYSGINYEPIKWIDPLLDLKRKVEKFSGFRFNSVLINLYRNGNDAMGWHADDEAELGFNPSIASVSLGETRTFLMRHKINRQLPRVKFMLDHGSLLLMSGPTQENWKHSIQRTRKDIDKRINLTYRLIKMN